MCLKSLGVSYVSLQQRCIRDQYQSSSRKSHCSRGAFATTSQDFVTTYTSLQQGCIREQQPEFRYHLHLTSPELHLQPAARILSSPRPPFCQLSFHAQTLNAKQKSTAAIGKGCWFAIVRSSALLIETVGVPGSKVRVLGTVLAILSADTFIQAPCFDRKVSSGDLHMSSNCPR